MRKSDPEPTIWVCFFDTLLPHPRGFEAQKSPHANDWLRFFKTPPDPGSTGAARNSLQTGFVPQNRVPPRRTIVGLASKRKPNPEGRFGFVFLNLYPDPAVQAGFVSQKRVRRHSISNRKTCPNFLGFEA